MSSVSNYFRYGLIVTDLHVGTIPKTLSPRLAFFLFISTHSKAHVRSYKEEPFVYHQFASKLLNAEHHYVAVFLVNSAESGDSERLYVI